MENITDDEDFMELVQLVASDRRKTRAVSDISEDGWKRKRNEIVNRI